MKSEKLERTSKTPQLFFKLFKRIILAALIIIGIGLIIPQSLKMPVSGATKQDYNPTSFWHYPWGKSGTHKGVDIFASKGTAIMSSTKGVVLGVGEGGRGGKYIVVLGPKWRIHYYAHLNEISTTALKMVDQNTIMGTVGDSGNAKGKPPHLHYSIVSLLPYFWKMDYSVQGWKKAFFLNPIPYIEEGYR